MTYWSVFSIFKPTQDELERSLALAQDLPRSYPIVLNTEGGPEEVYVPPGYVRDHTRSQIGQGRPAFEAAKDAFRTWEHFNLGWVRVANPETAIGYEEVVAVEAHSLGLWSVNISRILYTIDEENAFGYGYGTTTYHVERGEERFLLEFYPISGEVYYDLLAVSQPAHWLAKLGYFYTRSRQRKFARDSHAKMAQIVAESSGN